ncbi:MAG TPA: hypothetical protein ENN44_00545 [Methanoculleus sp.]|nr:hypothetical protein [Methanoculleus sp.]
MKHSIPCSAAEALQWIRYLDTCMVNGALPMADSVFEGINDEAITDEQTLRAALASRAGRYHHTHPPDAAGERHDDVPAAKSPGRDEEKW